MRLFFTAYLLLFSIILFAQKDTINKQIIVGIKLHYGTIFIHTPEVKNLAGSRPFGAEAEFSKEPMDSNSFSKCNCFVRNGIALSYFNLNSHIIGNSAMISYFLESSYKLSRNVQLILRAAAGTTYDDNPYSIVKDPENKSYTTHFNAYLQAGIGLSYNLNQHLKMITAGSFQHFSNGGYKEPNRGVNWVTASVGLLYYSQNTSPKGYARTSNKSMKKKKVNIDAGVFYVPKQGYNTTIMAQSQYIYGVFAQATKQYGRISALTGGIEMYYDKFEKQNAGESRLFAGIHAGHAFIFGRIIFSQQIGYHIYQEGLRAEDIYFRYGLSYRVTNHFLAGICLNAHTDNADFTDLRIMYRF